MDFYLEAYAMRCDIQSSPHRRKCYSASRLHTILTGDRVVFSWLRLWLYDMLSLLEKNLFLVELREMSEMKRGRFAEV